MRLYTVHVRPGPAAEPDFLLVKQGFSWPAFFVFVPWALWHRLWLVLVAVLLGFLVLGLAMDALGLGDPEQGLISLTLAIFIAGTGNDWLRAKLARRGYAETTVVGGTDREAAEQRFLQAWLTRAVNPATVALPAMSPPAEWRSPPIAFPSLLP